MNMDELLERWRDGTATEADLRELTARLATPEHRDALLEDWLVESALPRALPAAFVADQRESAMSSGTRPSPRAEAKRWSGWLQWRPLAAAACLMLALTGGWMMSRDTSWATVAEAGPGVETVRDGKAMPARAGGRLRRSDSIRVGGSGMARLAVQGLGTVVIGPEANLERGGEARLLKLHGGFIEIAAEKQPADKPWRIRTPQAEVAVIGTEFTVAAADGRTALRVREGLVRVTSLQTGKSESVRATGRVFVQRDAALNLGSTRLGNVLMLISRGDGLVKSRFNHLASDGLIGARLWRLGLKVDIRHYDEVQPDDLRDRALVILSFFADYDKIADAALKRIGLARAAVPVLCLEPAAYPLLRMTTDGAGPEFGFHFQSGAAPVEIVLPGHPLAADFSGLVGKFFISTIGWGRPAAGAVVVARLPGQPDQAVIFAYETGQQMSGAQGAAPSGAPARRTGLFLDPQIVNANSPDLWRFYEAAVEWSAALAPAQ